MLRFIYDNMKGGQQQYEVPGLNMAHEILRWATSSYQVRQIFIAGINIFQILKFFPLFVKFSDKLSTLTPPFIFELAGYANVGFTKLFKKYAITTFGRV